MKLILNILIVMAFPLCANALPSYNEPEILARANGYDTYNLPQPSYLNSTSVAISDRGDVAFKLMSFSERGNQGYWFKTAAEKAGRVVYEAPENEYLSDPRLNSNGQLSFSVFNEVKSLGVFVYDANTQTTEHVLKPSATLKLNYFGDPQLTTQGELFFRGVDADNNRQFYKLANGQVTRLIAEGEKPSLSDALPFSFLFRATPNTAGKIAFKTRLGPAGEWSESAPDAVVVLDTNNPLAQPEIIAADRDLDANSAYEWFGNVVSLSENGKHILFVTRIQNKKAIVKVTDGVHTILAKEGEAGISVIEPFNPKINNNGVAVFRAFDQKKLRGIYVADESGLNRLTGEGDMLISDLGKSFVLAEPSFPGLAGDVDINNSNEVVFACVLKSAYTEREIWGSAVYRIAPVK
ncbi:hypothetical protein [Pseudobdellovibrio exovorus]|uniref:Phytase-like domain-containing protein n=1 Tax=Pseudobdellovibrio exovorus JSS TaxID=1184267 RepID=M4VU78_9BACT|nr:hypothetical protein [Pseudobdellovibrio exovorus]AGH96769.1 hypothetical protein A11Q_2553 [Pseudobdellovibrio exovorus JSS]